MTFSCSSWVPQIGEVPDSIAVGEFILHQNTHLPQQSIDNRALFVDAISGKSFNIKDIQTRVEWLARALAQQLDWAPNKGSPWDKVVAIYGLNTIDYFVLCWAVHRLNGICLPIHPTNTVTEITYHMTKARCQTIFTCHTLVSSCLEAVTELSIPLERIYILDLPEGHTHTLDPVSHFESLEQLVNKGSQLEPLEPLRWKKGQGKTQVAYLCATSGTSGKQKLAMLTHYGFIMNIMQMTTFEIAGRLSTEQILVKPEARGIIATGFIPFSHGYGMFIGHLTVWRGDTLIVFPRFDMQLTLNSISQYRIERLYLVPSILAAIAANPFLLEAFDLSSVRSVVTGAAPLNKELLDKLHLLLPNWQFQHAWGLTETCIVATLSSIHDIWYGSSGSLMRECKLRLIGTDGEDIKGYNEEGEVLFKSPNMFIGYLGDEVATRDAFTADGWLRTGDLGVIKVGPNGWDHLFIQGRIKDMIKVKGMQVIPGDIESILMKHPAVVEAAVIGIPDEVAGERPLAFVVRSAFSDEELRDSIDDLVENSLHETHWLNGRIEFVPEIPKSQNGKVLKKVLRAMVGIH